MEKANLSPFWTSSSNLQSDLASSLAVETIVNTVVEGELNASIGTVIEEANAGFELETQNRDKVDTVINERRVQGDAVLHEQLGDVVNYVKKMQEFERNLATKGDAKIRTDFDASQKEQNKRLDEHAAKHKNLAVKQSDQDSKITVGEEKQEKTDAEQVEQNQWVSLR